jgi:hypothetical protein
MANRLLEALGPLGAIAGGLAMGQLQAQQARQQQERQALLDAMTLQQSRSALESDRLRQQMMGMEIEGYESPAERRRMELMRDLSVDAWTRQKDAEAQAAQRARQQAAIAELPGWYPTERDTTPVPLQGLAVPPMQQAAPLLDIAGPPKGMEALRQGWGQEITDNVNADHAVPGRVVQRRAEVAPTNPTAAELHRAGVLQGATVQDGMVTPLLRPIMSPAEQEMEELDLRGARADVTTKETEALYAPRRAEAETGMLEKEAAYAEPLLQLKMEAEAAGIELTDMKIQEVMQKIEQGDQQTQFAVQGLTSPDPSVRQASAMTLLGQSYTMSGFDQPRLQRDYDQMNTQLEIAHLNSRDRALDRQVDWANADTRRLQALISQDRTALDYEKFRQANLVSGQGGTKEQRSARDAAFKVMQGLVGEEAAAPGQVARQLMAYMAEAGPYAYDIYNVFYGYMDAELDALGTGTLPPQWQSVPWEQMAAAAGVQPRRDYDRWREGRTPGTAAPSSGSGARPFVPNQRQPARRPDI